MAPVFQTCFDLESTLVGIFLGMLSYAVFCNYLDCRCNEQGTNQTEPCDDVTGVCNCQPNVMGTRCNTCQVVPLAVPLDILCSY